MVNKQSPLPIYYQLAEEIKQLIRSGELAPGDLLPSEREYAEKYNISRMTVRQAINNLVTEGLIYRQKGRGTFIADRKFEQNLAGLTSFSEDMKKRGLTPSSKLLSFQLIEPDEATLENLSLGANEKVYEIVRIRMASDLPVAVETSYIPWKVAGDLQEADWPDSFYQFIEEKLGLTIAYGDQTIEAVLASDFEISHLNIEQGSPVLLMQRITHLHDEPKTPLEYVKSAYRADKYKFRMRMNR
ncbi:GntR family transcriptional regulator [Lentibacillus sediminis]|uniref:GntR family transcriptional regulator n=1 Tax=Lentibacillus sediminis TaxID=1940529 RepID=UPI000C1B920F|nr:GntR family transcriptional regulator [Lentibacillus sediminis]